LFGDKENLALTYYFMKKLFFFCYCILFTFIINAQPKYFEKDIAWGMTHSGRKIIVLNDDTYVIAGNYRNIGETKWKTYVLNINQVGDTIWRQNYELPIGHLKCFDFLLLNNNLYLTGEAAYNLDESNYDAFIMKLSIQGDSLSYYTTNTVSQKSYANAIIATDDNSLILAGAIDINTHRELYATKIAADGTILWQYIDTTYTRTNYFTDILPDGTGGYYLYGSVNQYAYGLVATGDLLLLHLNANGQMIDQHTYSTGEADYSGDMIRSSDGGFLLGMAHLGEETDTWDLPEGGVTKINADYSLAWINDNMCLGSGASALIELADGSIITTSSTQAPIINSPTQMSLVKIAADGTPMWSRQYGGQWNDYGYDLALSPDGGFVAVGRKDSAVVQTAFLYIVKTNCLGLLTLPQANFTAQIDTAVLRITLQNLSQYTYPDSIDGGHYIWDFGDGATSTDINPTHTYAQGGNYTVTLTAVVCSDTSVFVQEVSTWAVGIAASPLPPPKEGEMQVPPLEGGVRGGLNIYPNPTNNVLQLDYNLNDTKASFQLFNMMGQLLYSEHISGTGHLTMSTQLLTNGVYAYRVISGDKMLKQSKVTVIK